MSLLTRSRIYPQITRCCYISIRKVRGSDNDVNHSKVCSKATSMPCPSLKQRVSIAPNGLKIILSISERPASIEDRAVPGHWEGDLISGPRNTHIATLVERHKRYVMLAKVSGKDTETVINALIKQAHKLLRELYKSLTWDRGKELADHKRFTLATDVDVYFCDPHSPWQRVPTRTPIVYLGSTSRREQISQYTHKQN